MQAEDQLNPEVLDDSLVDRRRLLRFVETHYWNEFGSTKVFNINVWPVIRRNLYFSMLESTEKTQYFKTLSLVKKLKKELGNRYWLTSVHKIFIKKYHYLIFSDSSERKLVNGKLYHRLMDPIMDQLGTQDCLMVEWNLGEDVWRYAHTRNIFPGYLLELLKAPLHIVASPFLKKKRVMRKKKISCALRKKIVGFLTSYLFYKLWFLVHKPKCIFLTDSYGRYDLVRAAKESGIKVVELQHGIVNYPHIGYHGIHPLESVYIPDYFLVFGEWDRKEIATSGLVPDSTPIVVGSYYIEFVKKEILKMKAKNNRHNNGIVVAVTMQDVEQENILELVIAAAKIDENITYILIPRKSGTKYHIPDNLTNVIINNNAAMDSYQRIAQSDIHATVYSTCAYEAISFNIPTVFLNIKGLSEQYFGNAINNCRWCELADTPQLVVSSIKNLMARKNQNSHFIEENCAIASNYEHRLEIALKTICGYS